MAYGLRLILIYINNSKRTCIGRLKIKTGSPKTEQLQLVWRCVPICDKIWETYFLMKNTYFFQGGSVIIFLIFVEIIVVRSQTNICEFQWGADYIIYILFTTEEKQKSHAR